MLPNGRTYGSVKATASAALDLVGRDVPLVLHGGQRRVAAPGRLFGMLARLGQVGGTDEPGQERRLGGAELRIAHVEAEVGLAGGGHAVGAAAEVDGVEIALEDVLLRHLPLELDAQHRLVDLAGDRLLAGEVEGGLHVLLGDGGPALAHPLTPQVPVERPGDAERVDALVLEEVTVFGGDHGVDEDLRDLPVGDVGPVAVVLPHHPGHGVLGVALARLHVGGADVARLREGLDLRQLRLGEEDADADGRRQHHQADEEQGPSDPPDQAALVAPAPTPTPAGVVRATGTASGHAGDARAPRVIGSTRTAGVTPPLGTAEPPDRQGRRAAAPPLPRPPAAPRPGCGAHGPLGTAGPGPCGGRDPRAGARACHRVGGGGARRGREGQPGAPGSTREDSRQHEGADGGLRLGVERGFRRPAGAGGHARRTSGRRRSVLQPCRGQETTEAGARTATSPDTTGLR